MPWITEVEKHYKNQVDKGWQIAGDVSTTILHGIKISPTAAAPWNSRALNNLVLPCLIAPALNASGLSPEKPARIHKTSAPPDIRSNKSMSPSLF